MNTNLLAVVIMIAIAATGPVMAAQDAEVKALVEKGVAMAIAKGEEATLKAISNPKGPFIKDDFYLFAGPLDKVAMSAHPYKPELVGKDLSTFRDNHGNFLFIEFMKIALTDGAGWTTYWWPKPEAEKPSPKNTYTMKVPGKNMYIGCGFYTEEPVLKPQGPVMTAQASEVKALVEKGVAMAIAKGEKATLKAISNPKGPFIKDDFYLFAGPLDKVAMSAHPYKPELVGKDLSTFRDNHGNFLFVEFMKIALTDGAGWTTYWWPKPEAEKPSLKNTYVMKVPGKDMYIGAGYYPE